MVEQSPTSLQIQEMASLKPYNTLGVEAKARYFVSIKQTEQLQQLVRHDLYNKNRVLVLGEGSNILFADDFDGLVCHIAIEGKEVIGEEGDRILLKIGGGENWHRLVGYCVEKGWGGIENLSLIPGTVGAAPIQNIGAYGVELEEVFEWLDAVHLSSGKVERFHKQDCNFGYRDSIFKNELKGTYAVVTVCLGLSRKPDPVTSYGAVQEKLEEKGIENPTIADLSEVIIEIRQSKLPDPSDVGNAGSFFKNPIIEEEQYQSLKKEYPDMPGYPVKEKRIKVPAAWLIEETGWKGKVRGNAGTYSQHALVIVNHGGATGGEILELAEQIQESVADRFGIALTPEVNIIR
ncbi:MAG: UDP-N-acetylmuramate dehydrogenase [Balneolaceae bacterium]|nr:UDP-N-acetylmuramate dehydrogenase [Balneolaceae bacterium]